MKKNVMNIMDAKKWIFLYLTFFLAPSSEAQFYIWRSSENYLQNNSNPEFKFCYKMETESNFSPSTILYEMTDSVHFENKLEIKNTSLFNEDVVFLFFTICINGEKDSVVFIDSTGIVELKFRNKPNSVMIKGIYGLEKVILPISENAMPKKMTIVWGRNKEPVEILTIHSKRELEHSELMSIRSQLCEGRTVYSDDYYYYLGNE